MAEYNNTVVVNDDEEKTYTFDDYLKGDKSNIRRGAIAEYLSKLDKNNLTPPFQIAKGVLENIHDYFDLECSMMEKSRKWKIPDELSPSDIADIILFTEDVKRIAAAGKNARGKYDILVIYKTSGVNKGLYVEAEEEIGKIAEYYNRDISEKGIMELLGALKRRAKRIKRCEDRDLIAVNNGIFNYKTKVLQEFTPDLVFMAKSRVNYNPFATNINIHNDDDGTDWNVEDWLKSLSNDPEIVQVFWEILGAAIRPRVSWGKAAWLYAVNGNNGKGTLCKLAENLCGEESRASIKIEDFSEKFQLSALLTATAIIVDENPVGTFIDKSDKLKAVITNDVIQIESKWENPKAFRFYGFMIQCLNEFPRVKDKSDSFYRRQLFIPMTECFTGVERKYIKEKYIEMPEVLEYVMFKVLNMNYYTLSEPAACKKALEDYKDANDPVRQFWGAFRKVFVWDLLPFDFLFALYAEWFTKNNPSGKPQGSDTFKRDLHNLIMNGDDIWHTHEDIRHDMRPTNKMNAPEPLIQEYNLVDWMNPTYRGTDIKHICRPALKQNYRGLLRKTVSINSHGVTN